MDNVNLETTCNRPVISSDPSYRLTPAEIETMVKLRMTNRAYFSGKKNECMRGWRAILKHMGLNTKLSYYQAAKKWDNMRMKYKELKYSPEGVPHVWWGFELMDSAMHGLLDNSAPLIALPPGDGAGDDADFLPYKRKREHNPARLPPPLPPGGARAPESEVSLLSSAKEEEQEEEQEEEDEEDEEEEEERSREALRVATRDMESERLAIESERASLEGERALVGRERRLVAMETQALRRERAGLEREEAGLGRHRAALQRERAAMEREAALMEREREALERERSRLSRERRLMERGRGRPATPGREGGTEGGTDEGTDGGTHENGHGGADGEGGEDGGEGMDRERLQRRERLLDLFERLVENF